MATWPPIVDDDGTGTTGTPTDYALFQQVKGYIDSAIVEGTAAADVPQMITLQGGPAVHDVTLPATKPLTYLRVYPNTGDLTVRSIGAAQGGAIVVIEHIYSGGNVVWLPHAASGTGVLQMLMNRITSGATPLGFGGSAIYVYDAPSGQWWLAQHDQGKAIRLPFNAANFTADVGSFTVGAADVLSCDYVVRGNRAEIAITLQNTSLAGGASVLFVAGWPFTFPVANLFPAVSYTPSGFGSLYAQSDVSSQRIRAGRMDLQAFGTFTDQFFLYVHGTFALV
jgi:hypothetical protein